LKISRMPPQLARRPSALTLTKDVTATRSRRGQAEFHLALIKGFLKTFSSSRRGGVVLNGGGEAAVIDHEQARSRREGRVDAGLHCGGVTRQVRGYDVKLLAALTFLIYGSIVS
jgi:hypothetical protein